MKLKIRQLLFAALVASLSSGAVLAQTARVEKNIPYVPRGGDDQQLDLYLPSNGNFATVVFVHEGSLISDDKSDAYYAPIGAAFSRNGIAFAAINYRLGTANKWPAMPEDAAAAFAWVKKNISSRGGNPHNVFLAGHSSGSFIVSMLATDPKYLATWNYRLEDVPGAVLMGSMMHPAEEYEPLSAEKLAKLWNRAK